MIIVLGSVVVRDGSMAEAMALSQRHVRRSRAEPGCIEHNVSIDAERPDRLVFVERWQSAEALQAHFAIPESRSFARDIGQLAIAPPSIEIFKTCAPSLRT
jgi:quinol monooxygenase YgiN